jgi:hypothetical protein
MSQAGKGLVYSSDHVTKVVQGLVYSSDHVTKVGQGLVYRCDQVTKAGHDQSTAVTMSQKQDKD